MKYLCILLIFIATESLAQQASLQENSLHTDSTSFLSHTSIGGYGNVLYQNNINEKTATVNLERFVLFTGHKFNKKISFFSELELEDAKIAGGEEGGEIAVEECYLKFNVNPDHYFVAGLFLPRIGILNENHLPNTFNGNERSQVETFILPSTWRELGVGFYGRINSLSLNYSVALVNGLNSAAFEKGSVIRGGRFEGRNASANNLALTGALQLQKNNFKVQVSGYYGGTVGLSPHRADSLGLAGGTFGTPVIVSEADLEYEANGFSFRLLGSMVSIPDAFAINRAYANNTPQSAYGTYAELAYNIFETTEKVREQQLIFFVRYETLDMNAAVPSNGIMDKTLNQQHTILGLNYLPDKNVVIKADVRLMQTGSHASGFNNTFLNAGIGFSF